MCVCVCVCVCVRVRASMCMTCVHVRCGVIQICTSSIQGNLVGLWCAVRG